jgi:hypothetical protein
MVAAPRAERIGVWNEPAMVPNLRWGQGHNSPPQGTKSPLNKGSSPNMARMKMNTGRLVVSMRARTDRRLPRNPMTVIPR